jgi:hypothetical protein
MLIGNIKNKYTTIYLPNYILQGYFFRLPENISIKYEDQEGDKSQNKPGTMPEKKCTTEQLIWKPGD